MELHQQIAALAQQIRESDASPSGSAAAQALLLAAGLLCAQDDETAYMSMVHFGAIADLASKRGTAKLQAQGAIN